MACPVGCARRWRAHHTWGYRYRTLVPNDYAPEYGDEDLEYTWEWFQSVRELYRKAAERGRFALFKVDQ